MISITAVVAVWEASKCENNTNLSDAGPSASDRDIHCPNLISKLQPSVKLTKLEVIQKTQHSKLA
jgi:hypothetical protein